MGANKFILVFFLASFSFHCLGQGKITIDFDNESLQDALLRLDLLIDQQLSYNPQILPSDVVLNSSFESKTSDEVLKEILGSDYQLKNIGNYLIIQKAPLPKKEKATFQIKGGIRDETTGEELKDVSIYEVNSLKSTLSNEKGEFDLEAETNFEEATFVVSKRFYQDTIIRISQLRELQGPIVLKKEVASEIKTKKSIRERVRTFSSGLAKLFTSDKVRRNAQNVNFVDTRLFQASLVPSIGTNRKMSSQIKNRISLNILAGYSYGVKGVEIGGVYNIDREEVRGVQIGGFGNTVGGDVRGVQIAGFINTSKDYVNGMQMAGFFNLASDSVNGFQAAGFTNITRDMSGFQVAGFNNHTRNVSGFQLSGFINTTKKMEGAQVAGFINIAQEVRGLQLSVINIADTVASGLPFGIVNIVKKNGFISGAFESDDVIPYRLAFRSGIDKFYTVLSAGIRPREHWTYGMGFGSRLFVSEKKYFYFNPELRWFNIAEGNISGNENSQMVRFNLNLGYEIFNRFSITAGPALHYYFTNEFNELGEPEINIAGNTLLNESSDNYRHQLWVGYTIGIGF